MRVLMGAALTAKTFISILSQSNEKVTASSNWSWSSKK